MICLAIKWGIKKLHLLCAVLILLKGPLSNPASPGAGSFFFIFRPFVDVLQLFLLLLLFFLHLFVF
jgi:hypothetical protein